MNECQAMEVHRKRAEDAKAHVLLRHDKLTITVLIQ